MITRGAQGRPSPLVKISVRLGGSAPLKLLHWLRFSEFIGLLFNIVFDVITEDVREEPPWCVLYADDIVLVTEERRQLERKLEEWRVTLENRGMKISRSKTDYFTTDTSGDQQATIRLNGEMLKRVKSFKYLGSMVEETGEMGNEVHFRIQCGWNNWRKVSGVM